MKVQLSLSILALAVVSTYAAPSNPGGDENTNQNSNGPQFNSDTFNSYNPYPNGQPGYSAGGSQGGFRPMDWNLLQQGQLQGSLNSPPSAANGYGYAPPHISSFSGQGPTGGLGGQAGSYGGSSQVSTDSQYKGMWNHLSQIGVGEKAKSTQDLSAYKGQFGPADPTPYTIAAKPPPFSPPIMNQSGLNNEFDGAKGANQTSWGSPSKNAENKYEEAFVKERKRDRVLGWFRSRPGPQDESSQATQTPNETAPQPQEPSKRERFRNLFRSTKGPTDQ
ncbi:hypothetical protein BJ085DRAFT_30182 [Dimargaris cristalligena]|uniref:Uncharacterized protein n=1 Tax=Dimargaris cristalligena TaxID=215637 RepID=A0A4Q0A4P1_9FUNG|nr:hypothetical protein BJ085DRAFT_30182 [Dimargaris cristalligena]|eukprot:RKP40220.1 hypothetical protein BJ085DRAFT_30182 [Dimargaris cristalligena]